MTSEGFWEVFVGVGSCYLWLFRSVTAESLGGDQSGVHGGDDDGIEDGPIGISVKR